MNHIKISKFILKSINIKIIILIFITALQNNVIYCGDNDDIYTKINKNMDIFGKVYKEIMLDYVDEINGDKFMKAGIDGMLSTLDPYTNFLDESRKDELDLITTGKFGGIGITISAKDSFIVVTDVLEGYTAQKEGIKKGDKILEIDGISMFGKKAGDVRAFTRGEPGTKIKLKILRGNDKEIEFNLTREEIQLKNVSYKGVLNNSIGYIKLERFSKYAENEIIDAINELKSKGDLNGIILDLRDNPGGLLDAAIGVLNKFTNKGDLLVTTKGRKIDSEKKYFANETPMAGYEIPLVVLINENSASASEIVAGAIQDLDRGVIVGTKSFGKGLVQVFQPLSFGNQLKITNQKYFTPSGRWIQSKNYFKENKYGVFIPNPYFNQKEFKTLNGRVVYAEGGITPDVVVDVIKNNELLQALDIEDMYFKFAKDYTETNPYNGKFEVNEVILNKFKDFIITADFDYITKAEIELNQLKKEIEEKSYSDKIKNYINELENQFNSEKFKDFEISKSVISNKLENEILKLYKVSDNLILESNVRNDPQIIEAINIINNESYYKQILNY
jgi:carboxyl-terminal processing protease